LQSGRREHFHFTTIVGLHDDGADAVFEGAAARLFLPVEDRAPDTGIDDAIWMHCTRTWREGEAVRDASVWSTKGGEGQGGERLGTLSTRTDAGRDGWVGKVGHGRCADKSSSVFQIVLMPNSFPTFALRFHRPYTAFRNMNILPGR
jgi:hypothetical protein